MKKFNLFNRNKKDKDKIDENIANNALLTDSNEDVNLKEDLEFYMIRNRNRETADDAISLRSIDYNKELKWNKKFSNFGSKSFNSKSLKHRNNSVSYNLNIISENGETPTRINSPNVQFQDNINFKLESSAFRNDKLTENVSQMKNNDQEYDKLNNTTFEICDDKKYLMNDIDSKIFTKIPDYGFTSAAILISRHNSTSSTHSICKPAWIETENGRKAQNSLCKEEIERQNIIHELLTGEIDSIIDLKGVIKHYKEPMEILHLLNASDSYNIFYNVEKIIPIYEALIDLLEKERAANGIIFSVGLSFLKWSESLEPIIKYCTNLYISKLILEEKRKEKEINEFLQRCTSSKFSRKLDLWNFLDNPRSRLMKYPLLFERILKSTDDKNPDAINLNKVLKNFEIILTDLDRKTGEQMCNYFLGRIDFQEQNQHIKLVKRQKILLLEGSLKIGRSVNFQKVHAFLFQEALVFTKSSGETGIESTRYTVYGNPLPTDKLILENINDDEIKMGSFRSTFSSDKGSRNVFRLTLLSSYIPESELIDKKCESEKNFVEDKYEQSSYDGRLLKNSQTILQVSKLEEKQLWLNTLRKVVAKEIKRDEC